MLSRLGINLFTLLGAMGVLALAVDAVLPVGFVAIGVGGGGGG